MSTSENQEEGIKGKNPLGFPQQSFIFQCIFHRSWVGSLLQLSRAFGAQGTPEPLDRLICQPPAGQAGWEGGGSSGPHRCQIVPRGQNQGYHISCSLTGVGTVWAQDTAGFCVSQSPYKLVGALACPFDPSGRRCLLILAKRPGQSPFLTGSDLSRMDGHSNSW